MPRGKCEVCGKRDYVIFIKDGVKRCPRCQDVIMDSEVKLSGKDLETLREKAYTLAKIIKIVHPYQTKGESVEDTIKRLFEDASLVRKIKKEQRKC